MFDLGPATRQLTRLVEEVRDDQLTAPTPCPDYSLGDLLDHVHGLALAFSAAARKEQLPVGDQAPAGDASQLPEDWRAAIGRRLEELAVAWRDETAWEGLTTVAGVTLPAADMAAVAMDEVVVHGWDVARASGQELFLEDDALTPAREFVAMMSGPGSEEARGQAFGPALPVPDGASALDQVIAGNGRNPAWPAGEAT
jgi:uncharacterized protein (TIGR03086 family)